MRRPQLAQQLQILRNSRTMRRAVFQKPHHLLVPALPASGERVAHARAGGVGDAVEKEDLAEESNTHQSVYHKCWVGGVQSLTENKKQI